MMRAFITMTDPATGHGAATPQRESASPGGYLVRALSYSAVSILAILTGFIVSIGRVEYRSEVLYLLPAWAFSTVFALCYSICFHREPGEEEDTRRKRTQSEKWIIRVSIAIAVLFSGYPLFLGQPAPPFVTAAIAGHALFCIGYGFLLLKEHRQTPEPPIRHLLVWPVVLVVGTNFYLGLSLNSLANSWLSLLPATGLVAWLAASQSLGLKERWLFAVSLGLTIVATVTVFAARLYPWYTRETWFGHLAALLYALTVAAFVAVLEAWQITVSLARQQADGHEKSLTEPGLRTTAYYLASLAGLCTAILLLPLLYTFTESGLVFLYVFPFFALATLWRWLGSMETVADLLKVRWLFWRLGFGGGFLALVAIDALVTWRPDRVLTPASQSTVQTIVAVCIGFLMLRLADDPTWQNRPAGLFRKRQVLEEVLSEKRNALRLLALVAFGVMLALSLWQQQQLSVGSAIYLRVDAAITAYGILIVAAAIAELFHRKRLDLQAVKVTVIAFVSLLRVASVALVALALGAGYTALGVGAKQAWLWALPFMLCVAGGGALNDFFDRNKDAVDKPWRALPSGRLRPVSVLCIALLLLASSMVSAWFVGYRGQDLALLVTGVVGVIAYNGVVRHFGVLKTVFTGCLCALPLLLVLRRSSLDNWWPVALAVVLFVAGREILMDVLDEKGDRLGSSRTFPAIVGAPRSTVLGFGLQLVGMSVLTFTLAHLLSTTGWILQVAAVAWTVGCGAFWFLGKESERRSTVYGMWATLGLEVLVIVSVLR